jgi:hypothetical protein
MVDDHGEPLSKSALKRLQKQAAIMEKKAVKAAETQVAAATSEPASDTEEPAAPFCFSTPGVLICNTEAAQMTRVYTPIRQLGSPSGPAVGQEVWVRGRLFRLRGKGNTCFFVLREQVHISTKPVPAQPAAGRAGTDVGTCPSLICIPLPP